MQVFITREAQKQFSHFPPNDQEKIKKKLILLATNPFVGKKLAGQFSGLSSLKAWPYRIIYFIKSGRREVWVVSILHRQGAYK